MSNCIERSTAIYHTTGAAILGTAVVVPDPLVLGNIWKNITVVNDSDQDIKVDYKTIVGYDGTFIVPKSIKGFTRALKEAIDNTTVRVTSMNAVSAAAGNITFNLGS